MFNWVRAHREGALKGLDSRLKVTAEQMEVSRLRADLARVTMERDILGKAMAYFARGRSEVRLWQISCFGLGAVLLIAVLAAAYWDRV